MATYFLVKRKRLTLCQILWVSFGYLTKFKAIFFHSGNMRIWEECGNGKPHILRLGSSRYHSALKKHVSIFSYAVIQTIRNSSTDLLKSNAQESRCVSQPRSSQSDTTPMHILV